jgi:regulatory protein
VKKSTTGGDDRPAEFGEEQLEQWALDYLARYASSAENLRRVLRRRVLRRGADDKAAVPLIEALVERYQGSGLLDDNAYAAARAQSLHRRGDSLHAIRARLQAKGIAAETVAAALGTLRDSAADPDLAAACAFARRRRLGPYRRGAADRERDLAAFARAGFSRPVAEAVLRCPDPEAAEALGRE